MHGFSGKTRFMGLIGDPIVNAKTPIMANTFLQDMGKLGDFVLVPMQVSRSNLAQVVNGLRHITNFSGAVVTMPHKQRIVPLLDELTPEAQLLNAVNVIVKDDKGKLRGHILDGDGFTTGLLSAGHEIKGKTCVLLGAGGAASAIAFSLLKHDCKKLYIVNRTESHAVQLTEKLRVVFPDADMGIGMPNDEQSVDILINATKLGMSENDTLPVPLELILKSNLIADCVIAPEMTNFLNTAKAHGKTIHTGMPMLSSQISLMLEFMGVV